MIEFLPDRLHLAALEVGDLDRAPALGGADHGTEHELEHGFLAEGVGDDLEPPALLDEEPFEQVCRPDRPAVGDRQAQVRDAGLEVVLETGDGARQLALIVANDAIGQVPCRKTPTCLRPGAKAKALDRGRRAQGRGRWQPD